MFARVDGFVVAKMEFSEYLFDPRDSLGAYELYAIRTRLTAPALRLDTRARALMVQPGTQPTLNLGFDQPRWYPLALDVLDGEQNSLLRLYHDHDPFAYEQLTKGLAKLIHGYYENKPGYATIYTSTAVENVGAPDEPPRSWRMRILPHYIGSVSLGGVATSKHTSGITAAVLPLRVGSEWHLVADLREPLRGVRGDLDWYPEMNNHATMLSAARSQITTQMKELYERGGIHEPHPNMRVRWGYTGLQNGSIIGIDDRASFEVVGWRNTRITEFYGGMGAFTADVERQYVAGEDIPIVRFHCHSRPYSRHHVARALRKLGHVVTFHRDTVELRVSDHMHAMRIASIVEIFNLVTGNRVYAVHRERPEISGVFAEAPEKDKALYVDLDRPEAPYVLSLMYVDVNPFLRLPGAH